MLLLFSAVLAHAQGMSDAQVLKYIQREVKAGTSQSQIAIKLMQRGVDMKQLQRVRQQVNAGQVSSQSTSSTSGGSVELLAQVLVLLEGIAVFVEAMAR